MPFSQQERTALLKLKGVGPTVLQRLEEIGISDCAELRNHTPKEIASAVATRLGSTCWKNSPQALSALKLAVEFARNIKADDNCIATGE